MSGESEIGRGAVVRLGGPLGKIGRMYVIAKSRSTTMSYGSQICHMSRRRCVMCLDRVCAGTGFAFDQQMTDSARGQESVK